MSRDYIGCINFIMENEIKLIVFDLRGCTTLKIGKLSGQLLVVVWDYLSHVSTTRTDP
jgi:hypothetical protein